MPTFSDLRKEHLPKRPKPKKGYESVFAILEYAEQMKQLEARRAESLHMMEVNEQKAKLEKQLAEEKRASKITAIEREIERIEAEKRASYQVCREASIAAGYAPGWGLAVMRSMMAGRQVSYDTTGLDVEVVSSDQIDKSKRPYLVQVAMDRREDSENAYLAREQQKLDAVEEHKASMSQRRDKRMERMAEVLGIAYEKARKLDLRRLTQAELRRRDAVKKGLEMRSMNEERNDIGNRVDASVTGDFIVETHCPKGNFGPRHVEGGGERNTYAKTDFASLIKAAPINPNTWEVAEALLSAHATAGITTDRSQSSTPAVTEPAAPKSLFGKFGGSFSRNAPARGGGAAQEGKSPSSEASGVSPTNRATAAAPLMPLPTAKPVEMVSPPSHPIMKPLPAARDMADTAQTDRMEATGPIDAEEASMIVAPVPSAQLPMASAGEANKGPGTQKRRGKQSTFQSASERADASSSRGHSHRTETALSPEGEGSKKKRGPQEGVTAVGRFSVAKAGDSKAVRASRAAPTQPKPVPAIPKANAANQQAKQPQAPGGRSVHKPTPPTSGRGQAAPRVRPGVNPVYTEDPKTIRSSSRSSAAQEIVSAGEKGGAVSRLGKQAQSGLGTFLSRHQ